MNVIARLRAAARSAVLRLIRRSSSHEQAVDIVEDVLELYRERARLDGRVRAGVRAAWDLMTLVTRPGRPRQGQVERKVTVTRLVDDGRHAWRAMWRRPAVSLTVIGVLTVGIVLALLAFVIVDGVLMRPLPYPRSQELLSVFTEFRPESGYSFERFALSAPEIADYDSQSRAVEIAAWEPQALSLLEPDGTAIPLSAVRASSELFRLLEVQPAVGRVLTTADDRAGAPCVAILNHALWQERFGGSRDVIGRRISLSATTCEVIGVMPAGFGFPSRNTMAWLPLALDPDPNTRANHGLVAVGRLRGGHSLASANAELSALMAAWASEYPHNRGHGIVIRSMKDDVVGPVSRQLTVLGWAVGLVLLVITANVAGLLLAHGEARKPEFAVRVALGATRLSLVRQLLFEGLLLASVSAIAGIALAWAALDPFLANSPHGLPRAAEIRIGPQAVGCAALLAAIIGTLIGLLPAARLTRGDLSGGLKGVSRGQSLAFSLRAQGMLVIGELGLAVALTAAAVLLAQSFVRLQEVPLGFDPDGSVAATVSLPEAEEAPGRPQRFYAALIERLAQLPGVSAAGATSSLPMHDNPPPDDFTIEGRRVPPPSEPGSNAHYVMVTPGTFDALGIQLIRGRAIGTQDTPAAPGVAIVNEAAAATYWPGEDPVGRRIRYATGVANGQWSGWGPWLTIVGVARDVRYDGLTANPRPAIYVAHAQRPRAPYTGSTMTVVIRHDPQTGDLAQLVRTAARQLDGAAVVSAPRPIQSVVADDLARPRFMGWVMGIFAVVSLGIAAVGVYGVIAYGVARRTREIGLRMALGSSPVAVAWLIGRQTIALLLGGLTLGGVAAAWMSGYVRSVLFGIGPYDPATYLGVAGILGVVVCVAVALPISRAMSVDPLTALRSE